MRWLCACLVPIALLVWALNPKPNLIVCSVNAEESAACAILKNILFSQKEFQSKGVLDANRNGVGEYGYASQLVSAGLLSKAFAKTNDQGCVELYGYYFWFYLPSAQSAWLSEHAGAMRGLKPCASQAEMSWGVLAWPSDYGNSAKIAFYIRENGDLFQSKGQSTLSCATQDGPRTPR
ncbi:MAG: hypothetical protein GY926_09920 [bacterium]|nr:hypothetical protein [bacterium]